MEFSGWPEPVVRVQSIAGEGAAAIPSRYVKPPPQRPCMTSCSAAVSLPAVDLLADDGEAVVAAVKSACTDWGIFQAVRHGISPELMRKVREEWLGFFRRPPEEKERYANSPATYEGYGSRLGVEKNATLDWGDYYYLVVVPRRLVNADRWPASPPSLRAITEKYCEEVFKLCGRVMQLLSSGLGLDAGELQEAAGGEGVNAALRVNFYPKCSQPELTLGLSAHSDPGALTILHADDRVPGLQVKKDGRWLAVNPVPADTLIVLVGDQIQILSNGVYKGAEHRVTVSSAAERLSMAFFCNPRSDVPLSPIPRLLEITRRPALYPPMTFNEYRALVRTKGPVGKVLLDSPKVVADHESVDEE